MIINGWEFKVDRSNTRLNLQKTVVYFYHSKSEERYFEEKKVTPEPFCINNNEAEPADWNVLEYPRDTYAVEVPSTINHPVLGYIEINGLSDNDLIMFVIGSDYAEKTRAFKERS